MKTVYLGIMLLLCLSLSSAAQQTVNGDTNSVVPSLVKFSGILSDGSGKALTGVVGVTFSLYKDEQGGAPLWIETQNVTADKTGHYSVLLGSTKSAGLPSDMFASGEARWLAVQAAGEEEQPRTMLVAVPYAMKAGDAQTLGGLPASAFAMANASATPAGPAKGTLTTGSSAKVAGVSSATTGTGAADFIPLWTSATNQGDSIIYQSGTEIGINTKTPGATLGVNGSGIFTSTVASQALTVTQSVKGDAIVATASGIGGVAITGTSTSTTSSFGNGIGVVGFSSNPIGYGVQGSSINVGVAGNGFSIGGTTGTGVQGTGGQYGVYGEVASSLFPANQAGVYGNTASASATAYGVEGAATASTGNSVGVYGASSAPKGYGVEGVSPNVGLFGQGNYGLDAHGSGIAVKGTASVSGAYAGWFQGGPVLVTGNGNNMVAGDAGCGKGYAGIGFPSSNTLTGCTNYALLGQSNGGTFLNASGTAFIHFRSNNNELAHIDNAGNMDIEGINGGGNLKVTGRVTSGNVIAAVTASNQVGASSCTGVLAGSNTACAVPNMTLTKTTANPSVLVMVNIGGVVTDQCSTANFYLVVDGQIKALSSISLNTNNSAGGDEIGNLNIVSLLNLSAGSHTFQVQEATDEANASCNAFTLATTVSVGDGSRGSQRSLVVREF